MFHIAVISHKDGMTLGDGNNFRREHGSIRSFAHGNDPLNFCPSGKVVFSDSVPSGYNYFNASLLSLVKIC